MGLNANYMIAPSLQEFYVDSVTGLPMANGKVYFYADNNRTSLKAIYTLTETVPGTYVYTPIANPMTLSGVGTSTDGAGNDIKVYYYPYDANGNVQLYFVEVYDANGLFQWSRVAWPNLVTETAATTNLENFIGNGQFLYNSPPLNNAITVATTVVAPGNWIYDRSSGASDTDTVSFTRFSEYTQSPENSPRFAALISCVEAGNATYKYFGKRFYDVNKFSSDTQDYTLGFFASTTSPFTVNIFVRKYFGTGGTPSSTQLTAVGSVNITSTYPGAPSLVSFVFGGNESFTLGTNNDDYVDILFGFPLAAGFNFSVTDVMLVLGDQTSATYPIETANQQAYQSFVGHNDFNIYLNYASNYLPVYYTPNGYLPMANDVGRIIARLQTTAVIGELALAGQTIFYNNVSSDLIPYSRLGNVLWNATANEYSTGMGANYVTCLQGAGNTGNVFIFSNQAGTVVGLPTDGVTSTTFTFSTAFTNQSSAFAFNASYAPQSTTPIILVRGTVVGTTTAPSAQNSGFTLVNSRNNTAEYALFSIQTIAESGLTSGHYFSFSTTTTNYYVWFKLNGSGSDPAPGGTGIPVNLLTGDTAADVALKITAALNGGYGSNIAVVGGSNVVAGSYFTFGSTAGGQYALWFSVAGVGTAPSIAGYTNINCNVSSANTAAQVATAIKAAINRFAYGLPNSSGLVLMGQDINNLYAVDGSTRASEFGVNGTAATLGAIGSFGYSYNLFHTHAAATTTTTTTALTQTVLAGMDATQGAGSQASLDQGEGGSNLNLTQQPVFTAASTSSSTTTITGTGNEQSQPYSLTVNYFIKY